MPDAGALDPRRELAADLLGELSSDLVAEEGGDVFGFDGQDGLPRKLFIEGFEDGWRAEHQISGVFELHQTPVVGLGEDVEHRTALLGIVVEDAMQVVGREGVGEGLRALPVVDAQKGVVGKGETDAGGGELAGQPANPLSRGEVVSKIWEYIRSHNLQNPENRREILADDKLTKVFGTDKVTMFEMNKHLARHLK